jgi:hypothetical protein
VDEGSGNNAKEVSLELAGASNHIYDSTGTSVLQYKKVVPSSLETRASSDASKGPVLPQSNRRKGVLMLYESTKSLLQGILQSLETGDQTRWDDQTESGNECLYEMHQMSKPLYKAYRSDSFKADSLVQSTLHDKLNRAMPHVRTMVIAIRHKDQTRALESGKTALAEMNGIRVASGK